MGYMYAPYRLVRKATGKQSARKLGTERGGVVMRGFDKSFAACFWCGRIRGRYLAVVAMVYAFVMLIPSGAVATSFRQFACAVPIASPDGMAGIAAN